MPTKILLLIQTPADVEALPAAAQTIKTLDVSGVWIVFSPVVTVDQREAAAKFDIEIQQLADAERQAASRSDYGAAEGYKKQREGKVLDRATALRNAWKSVPEETRRANVNRMIESFVSILNPERKVDGVAIKFTGHSDHYDTDQWVAMLNSLSGAWFAPFTPGSFSVAWPSSLAKAASVQIPVKPMATQKPEPFPYGAGNAVGTDTFKKTRGDELASLRHFALVAAAKKAGVDHKGKSKAAIIAGILAAETQPEPALA